MPPHGDDEQRYPRRSRKPVYGTDATGSKQGVRMKTTAHKKKNKEPLESAHKKKNKEPLESEVEEVP